MPLKPEYLKQFKKDLNKIKKSGNDYSDLKPVMLNLINQIPLDKKFRDHKLVGNFKGRRECHIKADLLLVYRIDRKRIIFECLGSHSKLFD